MRFDAAVIGSGPAGATAARLLAKAGWRIALIEKAEFPRRKVCGEFISAATLPVLEACGVAERFHALAGPPVSKVGLHVGNIMTEAPLPRGEAGCGRALGREHLDVLLRDAAVAAGARLFQPAEVAALKRTAEGHTLIVKQADEAQTIDARLVIAACGSWNTKGPFAVGGEPSPSDQFAFKAHFRGGSLPQGLITLIGYPGGYGGMVHCDNGRMSLSCCIRRDALAKARDIHGGKAAEAVFTHIAATTKGARLALEGAVVEGPLLSTGPVRPGLRQRHDDGIFFAGNIAGEAFPIIAEGISMAIQSSWLLAQTLIAAGPDVAARYERAWKKQFATRIRAASLFAHLALQDQARAAAARLVQAFPAILTVGAALSGKVTPVTTPQVPLENWGGSAS